MFKSSFAQDLLQETRHQLDLQEEILPKELLTGGGQGYKSQFAASTHGPLDNVGLNMEAEATLERRRPASKFGSNLDNLNESGGGDINHDLHTSDLGTSDFSSSELWPPSNSSSPFEYAPRYRGGRGEVGSGSERSGLNSPGDTGPRDNRLNNAPNSSFLNLQSSMQFSYLKRACMELDLGLDEDDWNSIAGNLLKDFNKNIRNVAINNVENSVNLGDFLSELQSLRDEKKRRHPKDDNSNFNQSTGSSISEEDLTDHLSSKALTAKLAAKELETLQVRLECQQLYNDNSKLRDEFKQLKQMANPKKYMELQKEVEHLHWQLNKMENSRKLYELATGQLVSFLEQVSSSLSANAGAGGIRGSQSTLTDVGLLSSESILHAKRLSLASLDMARSQSMPGLADSLHLLTLPKARPARISAREKRVRRSSSVTKSRVSSASPLPSLAEAEDGVPVPRSGSDGSHLASQISDNQSTDSFPLYRASHHARSLGHGLHTAGSSDPLCVSTPKSYKASRLKMSSKTDLTAAESDMDNVSVSKRGTLTSLSSGSSSTASPPSSSEASGRENCSTGSGTSASLERSRRPAGVGVHHTRSMSSLLSDSKMPTEPRAEPEAAPEAVSSQPPPPEPRIVVASRAGRLLRSVRLLLAREKSYDVSTAEGRRRGRRPGKSVSQGPRSRDQSLEPGSVLTSPEPQEAAEAAQPPPARSRGQSAEDEERSQSMRRKLETLEMELRAAELVTSEVKVERSERQSKPVQHPPVVRKRSSHKREAPPRPAMTVTRKHSSETKASIDEGEEEKENCIMCIRERSESLRPRMKTSSSEQRLGNKRPASGCQPSDSELNRIQRSKSDAGDHLGASCDLGPVMRRTNRNTANTISSKLIKRSMSFNRIFNSSMLSRSKEYRL